MRPARKLRIVLSTAPDMKSARTLAQAALQARLAGCVNLVRGIESHYWWQGRVEKSTETLLVMKTTSAKLAELEKLLLERHPYDTPEILVLPLTAGTERYCRWLEESVQGIQTKAARKRTG